MGLLHPAHRITDLQAQLKGSILSPADAGYDDARKAWNLLYEQRPAYILVAESAEDVVAGVRFAADAGLGVAVMTTGHGIKAEADDALLIVTTKMTGVTVDTAARTARAEGGALWHHVLSAVTPHGLAPLLGSSPHVGVVGYSLGGGIGWLARKYGLAADSVRAVELVTADGQLRRASAAENSDLFWGLLGGGGSFGVVTAIEFALYPVAKLYGGFMIFGPEIAGEALRFYRDWIKAAPDELTSSLTIIKFPALPFLPEAIRGKIQVILRAAYLGDAASGAALIRPWLDWQTPHENTFREMPFAEIGTVSNDPVNPTGGYAINEMLAGLSDGAIEVITRRATNPDSPIVLNELRHAGGAIGRVEPGSSAVGNRDAQFYLQLGGPAMTPEIVAAMKAYFPQYRAELKPYVTGGTYLNFNLGSEAVARVKAGYLPESYARLARLKSQYDPANLFRFALPFEEAH